VSVNIDEMGKAKLLGEAVRATEGFSCNGGQVVDVLRLAIAQERLQRGSLRTGRGDFGSNDEYQEVPTDRTYSWRTVTKSANLV
jgi:hypothetical protein